VANRNIAAARAQVGAAARAQVGAAARAKVGAAARVPASNTGVRPAVPRTTLGAPATARPAMFSARTVPGRQIPIPGAAARATSTPARTAKQPIKAPGPPGRTFNQNTVRTAFGAATNNVQKQSNYVVRERPPSPQGRRLPLVLTDEKAIIGEPHSNNRWTCKKCNRLNRNLRKICGRQNCAGIAPLNLKQVVVDCANVGCRYGESFMKLPPKGKMVDPERHRKFHWNGVREALKHYQQMGLVVSLVSKENWPAPMPPDLEKYACTVPRVDGDKENDDYFVLKIAYQQNCFYVTNDNFRNWKEEVEDPVMAKWFLGTKRLLHVSFVFSNTGVFVPRRDAVLGFTEKGEDDDDESLVGSPRLPEELLALQAEEPEELSTLAGNHQGDTTPPNKKRSPTVPKTPGIKAPITKAKAKASGLTPAISKAKAGVRAPAISKAKSMSAALRAKAAVPSGHALRAAVPKSRGAGPLAIPKSPIAGSSLSPSPNTEEEDELWLQDGGEVEFDQGLEMEEMELESGVEGSEGVINLIDDEEEELLLIDEDLEMDGEEMQLDEIECVDLEAEFEEEDLVFDGEAEGEEDLDELELDGAEDTEDSVLEMDMDDEEEVSVRQVPNTPDDGAEVPNTPDDGADTPDTPAPGTPFTVVSDGDGDADDELELDDEVELVIEGDDEEALDGAEEGEVELEVELEASWDDLEKAMDVQPIPASASDQTTAPPENNAKKSQGGQGASWDALEKIMDLVEPITASASDQTTAPPENNAKDSDVSRRSNGGFMSRRPWS